MQSTIPRHGDHVTGAWQILSRREAYLGEILEHTFEFIGLLAPDGTLLEANRSALDFAGVAREATIGRPFWDTPWWTHDPALQARLREAIGEATHGQFVRFEVTHRDGHGALAYVDFSLTPVKGADGTVMFLVAEGRDITERKRAETWDAFLAEAGAVLAATLEYEETLRNIAALTVRSLADACVVDVVEDNGDVRRLKVEHRAAIRPWFADALERIPLDRRRPHLVWSVLETRHPVIIQKVDLAYVRSLAQSPEHLEALLALDLHSLMAVPLTARGRLLGALTFISSRQERQYGPDDLRHAQALADRAGLAVENAKLYRAAQEAIHARDEVLAIVAHDLRNPLSAIHATATVLHNGLLASAPEAARGAIDGIARASQRANRLVQDLLEIRRINAGRLMLQRERVPAGLLVLDCVDAHRPLTTAAALDLSAEASEDLPSIWADRHRVLQVFENLIGNAVKVTPAGGAVRIGAVASEHEVVFRVADTGPGIAPDLLSHLFEPFWQARSADRRGVGLGLSIAKEVVEAHGGRMWVESQHGAGSTFFFTIPTA